MQNINSTIELREAIRSLKIEHAVKATLLKEQFHLTYESLKPASLLKSTLSDITSSPSLLNNFLGTTIGIATGFLSRKIVVGASANIFRKIFGTLVQIGVTNKVAQHPDAIKTIGMLIHQYISFKKNMKSEKP